MQRTKTGDELEQERSDAEFARKLHEEMMAEENERQQSAAAAAAYAAQQNYSPANSSPEQNFHPSPAPQRTASPGGASGRITCQFCRSQNNIPAGVGTEQFLCGYCKRILIFNQGPDVAARQNNMGASSNSITGGSNGNNNDYPGLNPSAMVQNNHHQSRPAPNTIDTSQPILQGNVAPPANVQVRCGQCSVVNAVPRPRSGNTLQFMCGSCQSVNEVNI